jgi:hypothetical protein
MEAKKKADDDDLFATPVSTARSSVADPLEAAPSTVPRPAPRLDSLELEQSTANSIASRTPSRVDDFPDLPPSQPQSPTSAKTDPRTSFFGTIPDWLYAPSSEAERDERTILGFDEGKEVPVAVHSGPEESDSPRGKGPSEAGGDGGQGPEASQPTGEAVPAEEASEPATEENEAEGGTAPAEEKAPSLPPESDHSDAPQVPLEGGAAAAPDEERPRASITDPPTEVASQAPTEVAAIPISVSASVAGARRDKSQLRDSLLMGPEDDDEAAPVTDWQVVARRGSRPLERATPCPLLAPLRGTKEMVNAMRLVTAGLVAREDSNKKKRRRRDEERPIRQREPPHLVTPAARALSGLLCPQEQHKVRAPSGNTPLLPFQASYPRAPRGVSDSGWHGALNRCWSRS